MQEEMGVFKLESTSDYVLMEALSNIWGKREQVFCKQHFQEH